MRVVWLLVLALVAPAAGQPAAEAEAGASYDAHVASLVELSGQADEIRNRCAQEAVALVVAEDVGLAWTAGSWWTQNVTVPFGAAGSGSGNGSGGSPHGWGGTSGASSAQGSGNTSTGAGAGASASTSANASVGGSGAGAGAGAGAEADAGLSKGVGLQALAQVGAGARVEAQVGEVLHACEVDVQALYEAHYARVAARTGGLVAWQENDTQRYQGRFVAAEDHGEGLHRITCKGPVWIDRIAAVGEVRLSGASSEAGVHAVRVHDVEGVLDGAGAVGAGAGAGGAVADVTGAVGAGAAGAAADAGAGLGIGAGAGGAGAEADVRAEARSGAVLPDTLEAALAAGAAAHLDLVAPDGPTVRVRDNDRCMMDLRSGDAPDEGASDGADVADGAGGAGRAKRALTVDLADHLDCAETENGVRCSGTSSVGVVLVHEGAAHLRSGNIVELDGHASFFLTGREVGAVHGAAYDVAFQQGRIGAEVRVAAGADGGLAVDAAPLGPMDVRVERSGDRIVATVDSERPEGKTLALDLEHGLIPSTDVAVHAFDVDAQSAMVVRAASSLEDVLDASDDAEVVEYWAVVGESGVQVLVSVPHFSEKRIELSSQPEADGFEVPAAGLLVVVALLGAVAVWKRR